MAIPFAAIAGVASLAVGLFGKKKEADAADDYAQRTAEWEIKQQGLLSEYSNLRQAGILKDAEYAHDSLRYNADVYRDMATVYDAYAVMDMLEAQGLLMQADMEMVNARLADFEGEMALEKAMINENRSRREVAFALDDAMVGYHKAGVIFEGTPVDVINDAAMQGELDAMLIRHDGSMGALNALMSKYNHIQNSFSLKMEAGFKQTFDVYAHQMEAYNNRTQAWLYDREAQEALETGYFDVELEKRKLNIDLGNVNTQASQQISNANSMKDAAYIGGASMLIDRGPDIVKDLSNFF